MRLTCPSVEEVLQCKTRADLIDLLKEYGLNGIPKKRWLMELGYDGWLKIYYHIISMLHRELGMV